MKLHKIKKTEPQNIECRITNDEGWNRFAKSFLKQTEYIHSTFDVGRSSVSFSIRLAAFQASVKADFDHPIQFYSH